MKKTTALTSLFLIGGLGTLRVLSTKLASLDLTFSLRGEQDYHYL